MSEEFIRTGEVARLLGTTQEAVRWLADSGQLPYERTGNNGNHRYRFREVIEFRDKPKVPQVVVQEAPVTRGEVAIIVGCALRAAFANLRLEVMDGILSFRTPGVE